MSDVYSKCCFGNVTAGNRDSFIPFATAFSSIGCHFSLLGLGTALVYPTFLSAIAQSYNLHQRAESIGTSDLERFRICDRSNYFRITAIYLE
jgi:hypothetical protein